MRFVFWHWLALVCFNAIELYVCWLGISLKSQALYFAVYICRYLDFFVTLRWDVLHIYNALMKLFFIVSEAMILYFIITKYRATYDPRMDSFRVIILVAPCIILSFFFLNTTGIRTNFGVVREASDGKGWRHALVLMCFFYRF